MAVVCAEGDDDGMEKNNVNNKRDEYLLEREYFLNSLLDAFNESFDY